jgi:hypothetical protein
MAFIISPCGVNCVLFARCGLIRALCALQLESMANKREKFDSEESAPSQMNFGVFISRIIGGFVGLCLGVTLGILGRWQS